MNFKQLVVGWYAVLLIAAMIVTYAISVDGNLQRLSLFAGTVVFIGGALIYTVSDRHQVKIKRLGYAVVVPPLTLTVLALLGWALLTGIGSLSDSLKSTSPEDLALTDLAVEESSTCGDAEGESLFSECLVVTGVVENTRDEKLHQISLRVTIRDTVGNIIGTDVTTVDDTVYPRSGRRFREATDLWRPLGSDIEVYIKLKEARRTSIWF